MPKGPHASASELPSGRDDPDNRCTALVLVPQAPMQHVPGKYEPDHPNGSQGNQRVADAAPQPAISLPPRTDCVPDRNDGAQHSQPADNLNQSQPEVVARTQQADVFESERHENGECREEDQVRKSY